MTEHQGNGILPKWLSQEYGHHRINRIPCEPLIKIFEDLRVRLTKDKIQRKPVGYAAYAYMQYIKTELENRQCEKYKNCSTP